MVFLHLTKSTLKNWLQKQFQLNWMGNEIIKTKKKHNQPNLQKVSSTRGTKQKH